MKYFKKGTFDFAEDPRDSPYFYPTNNKVIGRFKEETAGKPTKVVVGLRPKMYSYLIHTCGGGRKAKGIQQSLCRKSVNSSILPRKITYSPSLPF